MHAECADEKCFRTYPVCRKWWADSRCYGIGQGYIYRGGFWCTWAFYAESAGICYRINSFVYGNGNTGSGNQSESDDSVEVCQREIGWSDGRGLWNCQKIELYRCCRGDKERTVGKNECRVCHQSIGRHIAGFAGDGRHRSAGLGSYSPYPWYRFAVILFCSFVCVERSCFWRGYQFHQSGWYRIDFSVEGCGFGSLVRCAWSQWCHYDTDQKGKCREVDAERQGCLGIFIPCNSRIFQNRNKGLLRDFLGSIQKCVGGDRTIHGKGFRICCSQSYQQAARRL